MQERLFLLIIHTKVQAGGWLAFRRIRTTDFWSVDRDELGNIQRPRPSRRRIRYSVMSAAISGARLAA